VKLEGEAYFEVAKDKNKRFVVSSNGIDIEALGTVFSVKSYPDDSLITTTLLEGKVKVGNEITQTILYPHEAISFNSFNHKFTRKSTINIETVAQWRNNQLAFSGESLGDIAVTLERMYNIDIVFTSEKARNYHFAGVIRNNSLSNVFEIISFTSPIQYKITNNVVEIQDDK
jgi:ferric-dicitrate binding protein FerR (iron transport regulator)